MVCLTCGRLAKTDLCGACGLSLVEAPDRLLASGLLVRSCYEHGGAARRLIHAFKYRGSDRAGWLLARALVCLLPPAGVLVPLPRASWRTISYGIDPAFELARRVGCLSGLKIWNGLGPPLHKPAQAGRSRSQRDPPIFWMKSDPPAAELILIDDVITTGRTLLRAHHMLVHPTRAARVILAVTATATSD